MVRAKFKCEQKRIIQHEHGSSIEVDFRAVYGNSPENEAFFAATPNGKLMLCLVKPEVADKFEIGKEYYLDLTVAG